MNEFVDRKIRRFELVDTWISRLELVDEILVDKNYKPWQYRIDTLWIWGLRAVEVYQHIPIILAKDDFIRELYYIA